MTQFEVMIIDAMRDMAKEMGGMAERIKHLEARFDDSPPSSDAKPRRRAKITAREATIGGTAFVALATAVLQALTSPAAQPAPRPAPTPVATATP